MLLSEQIVHNNLVLHNAGMNAAQNAVGGHHSCSKAFSGLCLRLEDEQIKKHADTDTYKSQKVSITRNFVEIWTLLSVIAGTKAAMTTINKAAATVLRQAQQPCDSPTPSCSGCMSVVPRLPH